jgi:hypothetical protein
LKLDCPAGSPLLAVIHAVCPAIRYWTMVVVPVLVSPLVQVIVAEVAVMLLAARLVGRAAGPDIVTVTVTLVPVPGSPKLAAFS